MSHEKSDAFVFFGASGDLAHKKTYPALQAMVKHGHLDVPIIGVARKDWSIEDFRNQVRASLSESGGVDEVAFAKLCKLLRYVSGDYNQREVFDKIKKELGGAQHPIHYLAIPPNSFEVVVDHLAQSGCAAGARVIIEKPFGRNLASAIELNQTLHRIFGEDAIFRIDHYLGKEAVQNLVVLRFANTFLEPVWNRHYVQSVQITMAEDFGVKGRGGFYEEAGAIRDVVQNHLLQVVGILAMEAPILSNHESIRDEIVKVFRQIKPIDKRHIVRGQFEGYRKEAGVSPDSRVETFTALRVEVDSWRWEGVPFFIRAGKCLPVTSTEVVVQFQPPPLTRLALGQGNYLRMRITPDVRIGMGLQVKKLGEEMVGEPTELSLTQRPNTDEMSAYERLLGDAMEGDAMLFSRQDTVEAAWRIVEPVLDDAVPLNIYQPGSWGPPEADALANIVGGWANPTR